MSDGGCGDFGTIILTSLLFTVWVLLSSSFSRASSPSTQRRSEPLGWLNVCEHGRANGETAKHTPHGRLHTHQFHQRERLHLTKSHYILLSFIRRNGEREVTIIPSCTGTHCNSKSFNGCPSFRAAGSASGLPWPTNGPTAPVRQQCFQGHGAKEPETLISRTR